MSKTKITKSPAEITEKWTRRAKAAVGDAVAGVNAVTESPMEKAIAKKDKMLANITEAITNGSWERGLKAVSLSDWKTVTAAKMQSRYAGGIDAAQSKRAKFDSWMVNRLNTLLPSIAAMPDMTLDDSVERVRAMMVGMSTDSYKTQQ